MGWIVAGVLLGLYLALRLQGWWFAQRLKALEEELQALQPALSNRVLYGQLQNTHQVLAETFEQIRQGDLRGFRLLERLSQEVPASKTLTTVEFNPQTGLRIQGTFLPGVRNPEEMLSTWAEILKSKGISVQLKGVSPSPEDSSVWRFELAKESRQ